MRLSDFDFDLPDELIALRPVKPRPASRLLVADQETLSDSHVRDLGQWLRPGDLLVFNDTKVIPARLFGQRHRETRDGSGIAKIEVTLIRQETADTWAALARPVRRLGRGDRITFGSLTCQVADVRDAGEIGLRFDRSGSELDLAIAQAGVMPLPPYIAQRRAADSQDAEDYQTIFAEKAGAVAAPTASLHFDQNLIATLERSGVVSTKLTLHVGAGTFLPVKTDSVSDHRMHAEWGEISPAAAETMNRVRASGGRLIPVGTTALRLIETAADPDGVIHPFTGETEIFITPGYMFRAADGLMTNFHLPKSTLLMLVSALMGPERLRQIYAHAVRNRYRFYSYGDSSLLLPGKA